MQGGFPFLMFVVIMAGGAGTRFWPLSRKLKPKQFLNITGSEPMIVETYKRISDLIKDEDICIILGQEHLEEAKKLFHGKAVQIIAEPFGRNTAPCIALGALYVMHKGVNEPISFLPADHYIANKKAFLESLKVAEKVATSGGIVTLGIVPVRPETGYGYIRREKDSFQVDGKEVYKVKEFVEKPDLETAKRYLQSGEYYWNAGIFVATAETIIKETEKCLPELYEAFIGLKDKFGKEEFQQALKKAYEKAPNISFDYGVMEKTDTDIYVIPTECGWSDVGSWFSVYELRKKEWDKADNLIEGETVLIDCKKSFISARGDRLIACLGLEDILIVDTPDALLVADLNRAQEIRKIVEKLKEEKKEKYL